MIKRKISLGLALLLGVLLASGHLSLVSAVTIYSYLDDQGNPVHTDNPETIPDRYRAKVKTHDAPATVTQQPSKLTSVKQSIAEWVPKGFTLPAVGAIEGLNQSQSRILTYAGIAALALIVMMYLSKSQLLRMLGFCLLLALGIGAPVLMYVSDGGPMDTMKQKATAAGQAQLDRLQQQSR